MEICYSVCPHDCPDTCSLTAEKGEDGKITKVSGNRNHPVTKGVICEKVRAYPERIYSPSRLLYPMKRVGEKGAGEFERITWEDAIEIITARWKELISKFGSESILPYSYGGTEGIINKSVMDRRFFHKLGATLLDRTICSAAGSLGYQLAYGSSIGINPLDSVNSKLVAFWGINALDTNMHQAILADNARKNGAKIIAIDVHKNKTANWADDFYMIMPGSDGALALCLANIIIQNGLADEEFLTKSALGFKEFKTKALEYPPERAAGLTGLTENRLKELAYSFAETKHSFIRIGNGLQHHNNGGVNTWLISLLPAITGAWKYKGGGALRSSSGYFPLNDDALKRPDLLKKTVRTVNMVQLGKILCQLNPPVRSLYVYNSNPAVVAPNQNLVMKGLAREDLFTVVHEQMMTETARWADIIIPATTSFEHKDLYASYWHLSLQWADAVISPIGEAKSNADVFKMLAKAFEFKEPCFNDGEEEIAIQALDLPYWRNQGITFERLKKERFIMLKDYGLPYANGSRFTASGRIEFKSEKFSKCGLDGIPDYSPPAPSLPLTLVAPPNHFFLNSTFANVASLKKKAIEPLLEINPIDAQSRGIKDGDAVKIENKLGAVVLKAKVVNSVLPGVVVSQGLWWREDYKNGFGINSLTQDDLSDIGGGATFFSTSVEIARA